MISTAALLVLVLVLAPVVVVGVPAALAAWPLVAGVSVAVLIVGAGFAKRVARRVVAGENREAAAYLEQARIEIVKERADLDARARSLDYVEQLQRRARVAIDQERREFERLRQKQEKQAGELAGARGHIKRLTRKPRPKPEDGL
jgi:ABC-type transport system involved in cytochrome bd biosynthesis fused ATPase/permease subunit